MNRFDITQGTFVVAVLATVVSALVGVWTLSVLPFQLAITAAVVAFIAAVLD